MLEYCHACARLRTQIAKLEQQLAETQGEVARLNKTICRICNTSPEAATAFARSNLPTCPDEATVRDITKKYLIECNLWESRVESLKGENRRLRRDLQSEITKRTEAEAKHKEALDLCERYVKRLHDVKADLRGKAKNVPVQKKLR